MNRVLVTGLGVTTAVGLTVEAFWQALMVGESGADQISQFDASPYTTTIGAEVRAFDADAYFSRKVARRMSRVSQLAVYTTEKALLDAGLNGVAGESPVGVFVGCSQGGFVESEGFFAKSRPSPLALLMPMNSAPASNMSITFNLTGPLLTYDTACSSASHAIGMAALMIRYGQIERAVVGGVDTVFSRDVFRSWCSLGALSRENERPKKACKPFSQNRDGTLLGEGAAMLVLESEAAARRRGARVYAEVAGYGFSSDAHHLTQPQAGGMATAVYNALTDARVNVDEVDYINAHGTGTAVNDAMETEAIKRVFGEQAYSVPMSGIKPAVGHTLAASGAIEFLTCVLAIQHGCLPPTLNYEEPDPACDLDYVVEGAREQNVRLCLSNSFAFGGSNVTLIAKRYE